MIIINKAILHILDFNSGITVFSDEELTIENSVETFLLKHIEKSLSDQNAKNGIFYKDSSFKVKISSYIKEEISFIDFSKYIVETVSKAITHSEEMESADLLVCDIQIEGIRNLVIFKCNNHIGFVHQVIQTEAGIKNDIINHHAIMPGLSQKIDEFAFVNLETQQISFSAKKYTLDGNNIYILPEILLECTSSPSPKEIIKTVSQTAKKIADDYGQDNIVAATAVKTFITENVQNTNQLDPLEIGREVFKDNLAMQADYDRQIKETGFTGPVIVDQESILKKMKNHKLKTDTGIELTIPLDYFNNTDYVEFNNNTDGSISIVLKHILNISNRS